MKLMKYISAFSVLFACIMGFCGVIAIFYSTICKLYVWLKKPQILWGIFDSSSINIKNQFVPYAHFYIKMKSRFFFIWLNNSKKSVKIKLTPRVGQASDFNMTVSEFLIGIGCEGVQVLRIKEEVIDNCKCISFDILPNKLLRISVTGGGGNVGTLLLNSFDIDIDVDGIKLKRKDQFIIF